ncbi:hypothetical protein, partial [Streptomyces turgidiscabies]|uniref:hypothetical protein n=1 Tax=Streptomyces turgidiscabies TaxID=85558 RepID=UPI0038F79957
FGAVAIAVHAWRTRKPAAEAPEGEAEGKSATGQTKPVAAQDAEILHESSLQLVNEAATLLKIIRQQIDAGDRFGNS